MLIRRKKGKKKWKPEKHDAVEYFPFSPGIPWKLKDNYILSRLDGANFSRVLTNRDPIFLCYGGLFETYFCLSILEALNFIYPSKKMYWCGDQKYNQLAYLNGLSALAPADITLSESQIVKYPAPLFLAKEKFIYFNCLFNYIDIYDVFGKFVKKSIRPISEQVFQNSLLDWNINFIPKMRNIREPIEIRKWRETRKINVDRPFILIFPDYLGYSEHNTSCLQWNIQQVKSFVSMVSQIGLGVIIVTSNIYRYHGIKAVVTDEKNFENLIYLIQKAKFLLAEELDIILLRMLLSKNSKIISRTQYDEFGLKRNQIFLGTNHELITKKELNPFDVFLEIKGN